MINKRRSLVLCIAMLFMMLIVLSGCKDEVVNEAANEPVKEEQQQEQAEVDASEVEPDDGFEYKQSPMLADRGLPPVIERLPKEPKLTNELPEKMLDYEIGTYGGTMRTARTDITTDTMIFILQNEPLINTPGYLGEEVTPNVLQAYEVSEDQKEFTFHLREGLKWSDGEPVTIEDVKFAVDDVLLNEELTPGGLPGWLRTAASATGNPMVFEVLDEWTFKISFDEPYGGFLIQLAWQGWRGYTDLLKPKHFLQQFHTKYTPLDELEPIIKEQGFNPGEWVNLFNYMDIVSTETSQPQAIGFPVLSPYIQVKTGDVIEFERNPYYFKVDAAGNQLPYIDKMSSTLVQDVSMVTMKVMAGEVDHSYEYVTLPELPLLKENEERGGYKIYMNTLHRTAADIQLNLTHSDPVWQEVVRDIRFRKALNLALNKQEIVDTVFYGFANPSTIQDTTVDMAEAGRILDEIGMTIGSDGYRVGPDGKKFTIPIEVSTAYGDLVILGQLLIEQWRELGLDVSLKSIDGALWGTRNSANELRATIMFTPGPVQWARHEWGQNMWAPLWDLWWNTGGKEGEEPPQEVKDLFTDIFSIRQLSLEDALKKREQIKQNFHDNIWYFIPTQDVAAPVAVNAKLGNFTDKGWGIAQNFAGEQWYYKE